MRYLIKITVVTLFASALCLLLYLTLNKYNKKQEINENISVLPKLTLIETADSVRFSYNKLKPDHPTLVLYFNSECAHCHYQIQDLLDHYDELAQINLLLISPEPFEQIANFKREYRLQDFHELNVVHINPQLAANTLGAVATPTIFLYDRHKKLIEKIEGEIMMESVINLLNTKS